MARTTGRDLAAICSILAMRRSRGLAPSTRRAPENRSAERMPMNRSMAYGTSGGVHSTTSAPHARERSRSLAHRALHRRRRRNCAIVRLEPDAQLPHVDDRGIAEGDVPVRQRQRERYVPHVTRQHAHLAQNRALSRRYRAQTCVIHATRRWLDSGETAERRGHANRSADIGAEPKRAAASSDDRRLPARGATGRTIFTQRMVASAVERIVGLEDRSNCDTFVLPRTIAPAALSRATYSSSLSARTDCRDGIPNVEGVPARSRLLDRDRYAAKGAERRARRAAPVEFTRLCTRLVVASHHNGIESRVYHLDASDMCLHGVERADFALTDFLRQRAGRQAAQLIVCCFL